MHSSAPEPAAQRFIERCTSGCDPAITGQQLSAGDRGQVSLEHDKMINRLAHYVFLICSQVRFSLARVKQRCLLNPPVLLGYRRQQNGTPNRDAVRIQMSIVRLRI